VKKVHEDLLTNFLYLFLGPAGTGKTETVKALGNQLGRFVLVFNCDENFDFQAMGRIFVGLCQVGAWGCFDEFNRLEERMLSAVSQQIQTIQEALKEHSAAPSKKDKGENLLLFDHNRRSAGLINCDTIQYINLYRAQFPPSPLTEISKSQAFKRHLKASMVFASLILSGILFQRNG
jgi:hypothetical protein